MKVRKKTRTESYNVTTVKFSDKEVDQLILICNTVEAFGFADLDLHPSDVKFAEKLSRKLNK